MISRLTIHHIRLRIPAIPPEIAAGSEVPARQTGTYESIQSAGTPREEKYAAVQAPAREGRRARRRFGICRVP